MPNSNSLEKYLTWAEIDLGAITHNVKGIKNYVDPSVGLMAVVKANAYGHGAVPVANAALAAGAEWLAVNRVDEGIALRQAGIEARILVLGYCPPGQAKLVVEHNLTPAVTTLDTAGALADQAHKLNREFPIHLKIDTGMSRFGLMPEEVVDFAGRLADFAPLKLEGIFSHLATAEESDATFSHQQLQIYREVVEAVAAAGIEISLCHLANSAASLNLPATHNHLIRPGLALYGLTPAADMELPVDLRPAMTFKTRVARRRVLPAGVSVGYNRTYFTTKPTTVALAPAGYGDGYPRRCSNRGQMLVRGQRASIIGTVAMDQTVLDVSHIDDVTQDEEVVVFGRQGEAEITVEEVARWAGTINYEIVTRLSARVPRVYV